MQSALTLSSSSSPLAVASFISSPPKSLAASNPSRFASIKAQALSVNYNSTISVFPAEACETIGGDTCLADICQETKLKPETSKSKIAIEPAEREYLDYNDPRTVLLGEACDVLGGEFCGQAYQLGIC